MVTNKGNHRNKVKQELNTRSGNGTMGTEKHFKIKVHITKLRNTKPREQVKLTGFS